METDPFETLSLFYISSTVTLYTLPTLAIVTSYSHNHSYKNQSLISCFGAQTEFMRSRLEEEQWDTKLGVWGRGVDPDLFSPARRRQDVRRHVFGVDSNDLAVLWLGRVVQEKQPGVWLKVRVWERGRGSVARETRTRGRGCCSDVVDAGMY